MAKKNKKGSGDSVIADFGHKDAKGGGGGGSDRVPEGDYVLKLKKIEKKEASTGNTMLVADFVISQGDKKGKKIRERFVMTPKALFRLRNWLEAMGVKVPDKKTAVKYEKYVGEEVGATVVDGEEYKNKIRSEVGEFIPVDQVEEDDEDEDDEDVDDDDSDDDDEDLDEVDLDEL